jgi:hypothetical protein
MTDDTYTLRISRRALTLTTLVIAVLVFALVVVARPNPAGAASTSGEIQIKGTGTTYAKSASASQVAGAGDTSTFSVKVINRGSSLAQFKLRTLTKGFPSTIKMVSGTSDVSPLSSSADGWVTPAMAPADSISLKVSLKLPVNTNPDQWFGVGVSLRSTTDVVISSVSAIALVEAAGSGTTAWDVFVRNGHDPFVGGSVEISQPISSPPLKPGQSTVFTLRLQNDGTSPSTIGLFVDQSCAASFPTVVKDASTDVTVAAHSGSYVTPALAAGRYRDLKFTIKRIGADPSCTDTVIEAEATKGLHGPFSFTQRMQVYVASP